MSDGITAALRNAASIVAPDAIRRRFGAKFAVAFIVVLVVIAGAGVFAFQSTETTVEHQTTRQLAESNQLEADAIGAWMEQQRTHARSVSQDEALRDDRRAAPYILLKDQLLPADVVSMHLVNETRGTVVASTELAIEGRSLAELDAPWTTAAVPEGPGNDSAVWATEQSYRSPVLNDEPVMAFASSVPKREGAHLVVVTRIQPQVDRLSDANSTRRTTILNTGDEPVLDSNSRFDAGALTDSIAAVRNDTTAATTTVSNGRVYALSATPHTDWVTVTSVDTGEAFAVRDTVGQTVTVLVVLAVISLAIVGVALGRHTVTPLKRLRNRAQDIESGTFDVDLSTRRIDEVGRLYGSFDDMRVSLQDRIQEAEAAVEEANAAKAEAEELRTDAEDAQAEAERAKATAEAASERLQERAADYSEVMQAVADGDLTERLDEDADEEAMRAVATEFNAMLDGLEATIAQVAGFADEVADETLQVATGAEEIETTSQTVSERIQEIADGAIQQHDDLERAAGEMDELSASIQEVAASSATVAETAADAVERGEAGRDAAESAIDDMAEIESLSADAVDQILALQERMSDIGEIIEFITDIAEQTNMLALNANIEAARADKDGDGFAVVADEVKDLAEEVKESATEIETLVDDVQADVADTVADMSELGDRVDAGSETIEAALAALDDIGDQVEAANGSVQSISDATDEQAASTEEVVTMIDEVTDLSDRTATESQQVSAAAEEQAASVSEVAGRADDLDDQVSTLNDLLDQFDARAASADTDEN
ncbi:methyl-accepting chemotaxis protein [Halobacterium salinarum]|uniref:methyl-accepting chemotaxis protein n=1 Tax=Halobacterium salinarum TaxID=2242 RepID=UPI001F21DFB0|nr:methyl-accepting chemotaxis protein [Halobacterium salinarum]MCF2207096.1 methyl-accepting chemotaxis protein [Halobacterium salinarum]